MRRPRWRAVSRLRSIGCAVLLASHLTGASVAADPEVDLRHAWWVETAQCSPAEAIPLYEKLLSRTDIANNVAAIGRVRLGICLEALDERSRAEKLWREVVERFPDQPAAQRLARERLGSKWAQDPASLMPESTLFYVELLRLGENFADLASVVRGTPFENPLESAGDEDEDLPPRRVPSRGSSPAQQVAAFLNRHYFRELEKIGGLALAFPMRSGQEDSVLGVFFPGESDILRGLILSLVSLEKPPRVGEIEGTPIYQIVDGEADPSEHADDAQDTFLALADEAVVWGQPRATVEAAIERFHGRRRSLLDVPDFQRALAHRSESRFFAYLDASWPKAIQRAMESTQQRRAAEVLERELELDRYRPITASVTEDGDDVLRAIIRIGSTAPAAEPPPDFWIPLATTPLREATKHAVLEDSLLSLAFEVDDLEARWRGLERALQKIAEQLDPLSSQVLRAHLQRLREEFAAAKAQGLVSQVRSAVLGIVDLPQSLFSPGFYISLGLEDADVGEAALRSTLASFFERRVGSRASRSWLAERLPDPAGGELLRHYVKLFPGLEAGYVRRGDHVVLGISAAVLGGEIGADQAENWSQSANDGTTHLLTLRPARIIEKRAARLPQSKRQQEAEHPFHIISSQVETLRLSARREPTRQVIEIEVPELRSTLRRILSRVATVLDGRLNSDAQGDPDDNRDGEEKEP